jgi:uncharacterized membrane protein YbhN (UPF0104 family)
MDHLETVVTSSPTAAESASIASYVFVACASSSFAVGPDGAAATLPNPPPAAALAFLGAARRTRARGRSADRATPPAATPPTGATSATPASTANWTANVACILFLLRALPLKTIRKE